MLLTASDPLEFPYLEPVPAFLHLVAFILEVFEWTKCHCSLVDARHACHLNVKCTSKNHHVGAPEDGVTEMQ
jgi:hypothetical protein